MYLVPGFCAFIGLWTLVAGQDKDTTNTLQLFKARRSVQLQKISKRDQADVASAASSLDKRAPRFLTAKTEKFVVNGSALPEVDFDVGESYAGLLPISKHPDESRQLYFWFFPSTSKTPAKEITIWLQGGPGAASTAGLLLENGPLLWQPGTAKPTRNAFPWNNLTNMVWIDQPVGAGFSVGEPNITNEYQLTQQFMGFFRNFVDAFGMHGYKIYLTGESYAGYYIPYIAEGMVDANDTNYFNFQGAAINDPIIGNPVMQFEGVAMQYFNVWSQVFGLNSTAIANISAQNEECGYPAYLDKYFRFPPPEENFPGPFGDDNYGTNMPDSCDIQGDIIDAWSLVNPCWNFDHIFDTCPILYSPLGAGLFASAVNPAGPEIWYNRADVRRALHAPPNKIWALSSSTSVFTGKNYPWVVGSHDDSLPPAQIGIVSKIIEATNNIIVGAGALDFQLPANGTLLVFQNMTWHGAKGFSTFPDKTLFVPPHYDNYRENSLSGTGNLGVWTEERGLTFYVSKLTGHEGPLYAPGVAYRVLQKMLGRIEDLSDKGGF